MQIIGGAIANLTGIPFRSHSDLQNLGNDDHLQYGFMARLFGGTVSVIGLDSNKASSPTLGETYWATDTKKGYACFVSGTWTQIGAVLPPALPTVGDILAYDGHKYSPILAGKNNNALLGQGLGVLPVYGIAPGGQTRMTNVGGGNVASGGGSPQYTDTSLHQLFHFTVTYAGDLTCGFLTSSNCNGTITLRLYKNGVDTGLSVKVANSNTGNESIVITGLAAGDVVTAYVDMLLRALGDNFQLNSSSITTAIVMYVNTDSNPVLFSAPSWIGGSPSAGITIITP